MLNVHILNGCFASDDFSDGQTSHIFRERQAQKVQKRKLEQKFWVKTLDPQMWSFVELFKTLDSSRWVLKHHKCIEEEIGVKIAWVTSTSLSRRATVASIWRLLLQQQLTGGYFLKLIKNCFETFPLVASVQLHLIELFCALCVHTVQYMYIEAKTEAKKNPVIESAFGAPFQQPSVTNFDLFHFTCSITFVGYLNSISRGFHFFQTT